jgi:hypothetical protein
MVKNDIGKVDENVVYIAVINYGFVQLWYLKIARF